eukprot:GHUV01032921.1.p1 GENE.GHUV01032921.1~~GHUV01032921.1.p1  ORF type:complete len:449 (+),score=143.81 GHUV01032921.1:362-1708(+)
MLMLLSLPCVLARVQLKNWSAVDDTSSTPQTRSKKPDHSSRHKHTLELIVPAGQTDIAVRLIKGMYQKQPDLSDLSQDQQLQLLLLADRFGVPKLQAAAATALKALSVDQLQWDTAIALLQLPDSCAQQEDCKQLCEPAVRKLLQQLGDLEQVWADEQLQQLLLALPHAALLRLLQHDDTRVASEATVVYTIEQWWFEQPVRSRQIQLLQQLMQQIRMQHLSLEYITSNLMCSKLVVPQCYTISELGIACLCASATSRKPLQDAGPPELAKYPAWTAARRPSSALQQDIMWALPLSDVRVLLDQYLAHRKPRLAYGYSKTQVLQGREVRIKLTVNSEPVPSGRAPGDNCALSDSLELGLRFVVEGLLAQGIHVVSCVLRFGAVTGTASDFVHSITNKGAKAGESWGCRGLVTLGPISTGAEGEAKLKENNLVHADGCLHLWATNIKIL